MFRIKLFGLVDNLSKRLRMSFGVATQDTSPILMDIFGKWHGIPISGLGQRTTTRHNQDLQPTAATRIWLTLLLCHCLLIKIFLKSHKDMADFFRFAKVGQGV